MLLAFTLHTSGMISSHTNLGMKKAPPNFQFTVMALMNSSAFRNLKVDDCVGCKLNYQPTIIDLAHLISSLSGFCPLGSTDVAVMYSHWCHSRQTPFCLG